MQSVLILGRQPALGLAELESLYGADKLTPVGTQAVIVNVDPCLLAFDRLGGSVKFCKLLTTLDTTDWHQIEKYLLKVSAGFSEMMPEGKMTLGLSEIGLSVGLRQLEATGLKLKKVIRATGRPVRLVPNKAPELNSAQVLHNKLTGPNGWELVFIRNGAQTILAQTVKVQDIESYTRRDRERPKRDTKVGMLPPKLAQILINLATDTSEHEVRSTEYEKTGICYDPEYTDKIHDERSQTTVLDPFCGTGVLLQEALLMGYSVVGSDLEPRMIEYSQANLDWLVRSYEPRTKNVKLSVGDATNFDWSLLLTPHSSLRVACETYLGRPFTGTPTSEILNQTVSDCNLIIKKFLNNIRGQLKPGTRLCLAVPAWRLSHDKRSTINDKLFKHLPLIDQIEDLGYNRMSFEHVRDDQLLYYREDQIVARQLIVITRK